MTDLIMTSLAALLIGAIGVLSYCLGRKVEKNDEYKEKETAAAEVRRVRASLADPDTVDRLHDAFKR